MADWIDEEETVEEINSWFSSTQQQYPIPRLADAIWEWREMDLSRLRLVERLTQEEIVELLKAEVKVNDSRLPVIHILVEYNKPSTLISLLDPITPQHLPSLFRLKDYLGQSEGLNNVLGVALKFNRLPILRYVVDRLGVDVLCELLCERCYGQTQLHNAVMLNISFSEVLSLLKDETRVHQLLSFRDDEDGISVLSCCICEYDGGMYLESEESFQSIIKHYTGKQAELLELAAITDNKGNTSFHHAAGQETSNNLTDLIKATCSLETRGKFANVLSMRNDSGNTALHEAVERNHSISEILSLLKDETRVNDLLSFRDGEGQSVLSYSIYSIYIYSTCWWNLYTDEESEESFQSIITHYTSKQAELLKLATLTDNKGNTSFHHAAHWITSNYLTDLIKATCSLETRGELANVLSMRNDSGITALHNAVMLNVSISEVLSLLKDETRVHQLLSIRDDEGFSVLSYSIRSEESFQSIIRHYTGKQAKLLELAAITDNKGNTSFHHAAHWITSNHLTDLIKATCSLETRGKLANVLLMRNDSGGKKELGDEVEECHSDNEFIYDWASDSLTKKRYMLFDFPSVLVMYNTVRRDGADEEAMSLEKCFTDLGFKVEAKSSFTKKELFKAIKDHLSEESSRNGQIVALMSHGLEGYINDRDGELIPLRDIERRMCPDSHRDAPKLLILQCCQARKSTDASSDAGSGNSRSDNSYCPTNADFCALMSTGAGTVSQRNTFIPFLVAAIQDAGVDTDISTSMYTVKGRFPVNYPEQAAGDDILLNVPEQAPGCLDWFKFRFCMKSILPVYLSNARKTKPETAEGRQQDPTLLSESDAGGEHQMEPAPSSSESNVDRKHQMEPAPSSSESNTDRKHQLEPTSASSESDADRGHRLEPAPTSSESDAGGEYQMEPASSSSTSSANHGTKRQREDEGKGAKRKKVTAASSKADAIADLIDVE